MPSSRKPPPPGPAASPITFVIPGVPVAGVRGGGADLLRPSLGLQGRVKAAVRVGLNRADGAAQRVQAQPGEDVVVLHLADGPSLVLHPENARDLLMAQGSRRRSADGGAVPGEVAVPAQLLWESLEAPAVATRGATRGFLGQVVLSLVEVIAGPVQQAAQDWAADRLGGRVDDQVVEGVYALQRERLEPLKGHQPLEGAMPTAPDGGATLVFIHGTFSNTASGFGQLWLNHPHRVRTLFDHYGERVFALDHATLGRSPIENALTLVRHTPPDARLHLVTHSRGGLVAEVLARACDLAALDQPAKTLFRVDELPDGAGTGLSDQDRAEAQAALDRQRVALAELIELMHTRRIRVERVVRVACPARGTLLASKRLDAYFSILKWALDLAQVPVAPAIVEFIAGVAQRRTQPQRIPGVAAMVPDSPLIRWLHAAASPVPGDLRVIAGDLEGDSLGSWVKTLVSDGFYWTDHDLVVQTRSMYGGAPRRADAAFVLDRGGKVTHFNYFSNDRTAEAVVSGLLQDQPAGYRRIGPLSASGASATGTRARDAGDALALSDKPAVFVLPGILGSHLKVDDERIWLCWRLVNGLMRLEYRHPPINRVTPDGLIGSSYDALLGFLAQTHEVIEFPYDWRLPLEQEAQRLASAVQDRLAAREQSGQPVRLLAHSMGGLLARTMALECPDVWARLMAHPGARLLMLGTPNAGSWAPMQCLSGDDTFGNTLIAFGAPLQDHRARQMMAQLPGFLQLQAGLGRDDPRGLRQSATWQQLADDDLAAVQAGNWWHTDGGQVTAYRWGVPAQPVLDAAAALRDRLDEQAVKDLPSWASRLALVQGHARLTPDGFDCGADGFAYLEAHDAGDGRVTHVSAQLPGVRTWAVDASHGDLPEASRHFDAYLELLQQGVTQKLERVPDPATRGTAAVAALAIAHTRRRPSRERSGAPTPEDRGLQAQVDEGAGGSAPPSAALSVCVYNGDLKFVRQPLMLGHYTSSLLTGTEAVVDQHIGGTMRQSLSMRQYPDVHGTHQFFGNCAAVDNPLQAPRPASVVVVGLGPEGALRTSELTYTVRMGVLALSQRLVERSEGSESRFELAATLIGSGGAGISVGQAAQAIAQGVREADLALAELNARLQAQRPPGRAWPRVGQLSFVELYLNRASEAWSALQQQAESSPGQYALADAVRSGTGALRRPVDGGYRGSHYDYIRALGTQGPRRDDRIAYTLDTRKRARTELMEQPLQARLLRRLVAQASTDQVGDPQIGRTLFNLLIPVDMGPFFGGSSEMLLQLDPTTAGIPWELLDTDVGEHGGGQGLPWAIRAKLVRTLTTIDHRQQVVDASPDAHVLVIGEPKADPSLYPRLPGARAEACAVRDLLRQPGGLGPERVVDLVASDDSAPGPDALAVINTLMSRDWRIVHIAGHGMPPEGQRTGPDWCDTADAAPGGPGPAAELNGVVLSDNTFLGPHEIRNMRVVPELVFVNCCHLAARSTDQVLASQRYDRTRFASGVAESLIGLGVRCVVAAGWAVEDGPAMTFATTFYAALLRGQRFIDAVAEARRAAHQPGSNTWAAYQCYGDPDWVLRRAGADPQRPPQPLAELLSGVNSPQALALALETLAVECEHQGRDKAERRARIRHLERRFAARWGGMGAVAEAFGVAWAAAGDRREAIGWYERALQAGDGSASLKASEQLGNLRVKEAWSRVQKSSGPGRPDACAAARTEIAAVLALLDRLEALAPSVERSSLRGSAFKRLAMLERLDGRPDDARLALERMEAAYGRAVSLGRAAQAPDLFYPALNALSARVARVRDLPTALDGPAVDDLRQELARRTRDDPDFWNVVGQVELALYEAVAAHQLHRRCEQLLEGYGSLLLRTRGSSNWGSVADQLDFVLYELAEAGPALEQEAVRRLRAGLREMLGGS